MSERKLRLTSLATIRPRPITWMLPDRIPYGGLTVLAGRQGQGKSTFMMGLAADLSRKGSAVLLVGAEDGLEDTVLPRLKAAGGNENLVHSADVMTSSGHDDMAMLPIDVPLLEQAVKDTGAALVVIDPIAAHLEPELNSNNDHSVRQATSPLARMAQATGCSVVIVAHPRKSREGSPLDWIGGAAMNAVRSALLFGKTRPGEGEDWWEGQDRRFLVHVKANGAPLALTREYKVESVVVKHNDLEIPTSRMVPLGECRVWATALE